MPHTRLTSADGTPIPADRRSIFAAQELRLISALVVLLGIGLFLALPFVLSIGSVVFLPLATALVLSIVLSPLADQLMRIGIPNGIASMLAVMFLIAIVILASALILQPALALVDQVPQMVSHASQQLVRLRSNLEWMNEVNRSLARVTGHAATREVVVASPSLIEQVAFATPSLVLETLLTLLMSFFLIELRVRLRERLHHDPLGGGSNIKAIHLIRAIQERVGVYILTVAFINLGVGTITACGAWAMGWNAPIMWGGLAALLNFLPYLGPLAMIGVLALVGIATYDTVALGLIAPLAYLGLHAVEANVVTPAILGRRFTLNPVLILFAFSYFTWIWGVLGALLSMPMLITLAATFEHLGKPNLLGFIFGEPLFPNLAETVAPDILRAELAAAGEPTDGGGEPRQAG